MRDLGLAGCCKVTLEVLKAGNEGARALYESEGFVFEVRNVWTVHMLSSFPHLSLPDQCTAKPLSPSRWISVQSSSSEPTPEGEEQERAL